MVLPLFAAVPYQTTDFILVPLYRLSLQPQCFRHISCFSNPSVVMASHCKSQGQHLACPAQASVIKDLAAARYLALDGPFLCCNDSLQHMQR